MGGVVTQVVHRPILRGLLRGLAACTVAVTGSTTRGAVASPIAASTRPAAATTASASASQFLLKNKKQQEIENIASGAKAKHFKKRSDKSREQRAAPQVGSASKRDYKGAARVFLCEDNRTHDRASLHFSPKLLFSIIKISIRQDALFIRQGLSCTRRVTFYTRRDLSYRIDPQEKHHFSYVEVFISFLRIYLLKEMCQICCFVSKYITDIAF